MLFGVVSSKCEKYAVAMQNTPASLVYFVLVCLDASMIYIIFPPSDPATWSLLYKFLESTIDVVFLVLLLVIFFLVVWPEPLVRVASWDCGQKCLVKFDEFFSVGTMKKNDLKLKSSVFLLTRLQKLTKSTACHPAVPYRFLGQSTIFWKTSV